MFQRCSLHRPKCHWFAAWSSCDPRAFCHDAMLRSERSVCLQERGSWFSGQRQIVTRRGEVRAPPVASWITGFHRSIRLSVFSALSLRDTRQKEPCTTLLASWTHFIPQFCSEIGCWRWLFVCLQCVNKPINHFISWPGQWTLSYPCKNSLTRCFGGTLIWNDSFDFVCIVWMPRKRSMKRINGHYTWIPLHICIYFSTSWLLTGLHMCTVHAVCSSPCSIHQSDIAVPLYISSWRPPRLSVALANNRRDAGRAAVRLAISPLDDRMSPGLQRGRQGGSFTRHHCYDNRCCKGTKEDCTNSSVVK